MKVSNPSIFLASVALAISLVGCTTVPIQLTSREAPQGCVVAVEDRRDPTQRGKVTVMFGGALVLGTGHLVWDSAVVPSEALRGRLCAFNAPIAKVSILRLTTHHYGDFGYAKCDVEVVIEAQSLDGSKRDVVQPHTVRDEKNNRSVQAMCGQAIDEAFDLLSMRLKEE